MVGAIEIFPWNENFETGIAEIDQQHRQLVELLNLLVSHLAFNADAPALDEVFERLKSYTVIHFRTEEAIWGEALGADGWVEDHQRTHAYFVDEVIRLRSEERGKATDDLIQDVVGFLTHWLALHIIETDKRMAKAVLAVRRGATVADAKAIADREMSGATRAMIDTVMSMYDALASRTVLLTREINRRLLAEAKLREAHDALRLLKQSADAASLAKSTFLANMSHEIRTPMNAILGFTYLLRRELEEPGQRERLDKIQGAAKHLLSVINDVLDLSKIEAGKLELDAHETDVPALLADVRGMFASDAVARGLRLETEAGPMPPRLVGDPTRFRQALTNLVSNALKFTERGAVTLRAFVEEEGADDVLVRCEVIDTGRAIPAEIRARLFSPFQQADSSTTRKHGGTGLGLAITKSIARLMRGDVGVRSDEGRGNTFWFTARLRKLAPAAQGAREADAAAPADATLRRNFAGRRVLVVEDDELSQDLIRELLDDVGLAIDVAADGGEAIEAVQRSEHAPYDAILMDVQMPRVDGLSATWKIRTTPAGARVPIIALSANAFGEDRDRCLAAGMSDFLGKPVEPHRLYSTLLAWLSRGEDAR